MRRFITVVEIERRRVEDLGAIELSLSAKAEARHIPKEVVPQQKLPYF